MDQILAAHKVEVAEVLTGDLKNFSEAELMYRIDDEAEVASKLGFTFKFAKSNKSAGKGGIYFWSNLRDAVKYAYEGKASIIFMVSRPKPATSHRVSWTFDYMRSRMDQPVEEDIFLDGVSTYTWNRRQDCRDEFVKSGLVGDVFKPELLVKLQFKEVRVDT